MIKNIKRYLEHHDGGLDFFSLFPLILFTVIMIAIFLYVFFVMSNKSVDELKNLPLNDQNDLDYGKKE